MPERTRTARQWLATARRVRDTDPALAERIRAALIVAGQAHPDDPLSVDLPAGEAAALDRLAPLTARWMPATPGRVPPAEDARAAAEAADAFVRAHQRRPR